MAAAPEWPGDARPANASRITRGAHTGGGGYWLVLGMPPGRFWEIPADRIDHAIYGPPGTMWAWTSAAEAERHWGGPEDHLDDALRRLLRKFRPFRGPVGADVPALDANWIVPAAWADPALPIDWNQMRYAQTVIHGKVGQAEEVAHVLKWRLSGGEAADLTPAQLTTFGNQVRDRWFEFMRGAVPGMANGVADALASDLQYDEVRTSYLEQNAPGAKPAYLIPTIYSPFSQTINSEVVPGLNGKSTANNLPWEVALCLSLGTNWRGPRNRGRLYLGPLGGKTMGSSGMFDTTVVRAIGAAFGTEFVANLNQNSQFDLSVVSNAYATSVPVQGIRVGAVPDSQRRRRRNQVEAHTLVWGTGVGLAVA